jgi:hypothetical protein
VHSKLLLAFCIAALSVSVASCGDKSKLSSEDIDYVRLTAALMKAKSSAPPSADSLWLKSKLDSIMQSFHTNAKDYVARTTALADDPEHTLIIYKAINDTLGLK